MGLLLFRKSLNDSMGLSSGDLVFSDDWGDEWRIRFDGWVGKCTRTCTRTIEVDK